MRRRDFIVLSGGAVATWPLAARSQQPTKPVVGWLGPERADAVSQHVAAFHEGLSAAGFVEGKDVIVEYRWAEEHLDRVPALALDLIRRWVNVILTISDVPTLVVKGATGTIPIVFITVVDPIDYGFSR